MKTLIPRRVTGRPFVGPVFFLFTFLPSFWSLNLLSPPSPLDSPPPGFLSNRALIDSTLAAKFTCGIDDRLLANFVGMYGPDLKDAKINNKTLEGDSFYRVAPVLLDTLKAYEASLKSLPAGVTVVTACHSNCETHPNRPFPLQKAQVLDLVVVRETIRKVELAVALGQEIFENPIKAVGTLRRHLEQMKPGEDMFIPVSYSNPKGGHATVLEIEKQPNQNLTLRLYNLGDGARYHAHKEIGFETLYVTFMEYVHVPQNRLATQSFTTFLSKALEGPPAFHGNWTSSHLYEVLLPSLGGQFSARKVDPHLLRPIQYIGNCPVASAFAVLDKLLFSEALAERIRFLTLSRICHGYFEQSKQSLSSGVGAKARRSLLQKGIKAALEQGERAFEVRGLIGAEALGALEALKDLRKAVKGLEAKDLDASLVAPANLDVFTIWKGELRKPLSEIGLVDASALKGVLGKPRPLSADYMLTIEGSQPQVIATQLANALSLFDRADPADFSWLLKRTISQLPISETFWADIPASQTIQVQGFLLKLQLLHISHLHGQVTAVKNPFMTVTDLTHVLKLCTIIDALSLGHPAELGPGFSSLVHPWMLSLLGIHQDPPFTDTYSFTIVGAASVRETVMAMRAYWLARSPLFPDPFGFMAHSIAPGKDRLVRHVPVNEDSSQYLTQKFGKDFWAQGPGGDVALLLQWLNNDTQRISHFFPELSTLDRVSQAVSILTQTDKSQRPYVRRLASLEAAHRSSLIIDFIRLVEPSKVPKPDFSSLCSTAARKDFGQVTWWEISRPFTDAVLRQAGDRGFLLHLVSTQSKQAFSETALYHNSTAADLRGHRRRFPPGKGSRITPLDLDLIFGHGYQAGRDFGKLSSVELQPIEDVATFFEHPSYFLNPIRLQDMGNRLIDPGVLEASLLLNPSTVAVLREFFSVGFDWGRLSQGISAAAYFGYLARVLRDALHAMETPRLPDHVIEQIPDGSHIFSQLIEESSVTDAEQIRKVIHYYRAKSFASRTHLTLSEAAEFISSYNILETYGFPVSNQHEPDYSVHEIKEAFTIYLREELQRHLEDIREAGLKVILDTVVRDLDPEFEGAQWVPYGSYPYFTNSARMFHYDALTGVMTRFVLGTVALPPAIRSDPIFAHLLGETVQSLQQVGDSIYLHEGNGKIYHFIVQGTRVVTQTDFPDIGGGSGVRHQAFYPEQIVNLPLYSGRPVTTSMGILWVPISAARAPGSGVRFLYDGPHKHLKFSISQGASSVWQAATTDGFSLVDFSTSKLLNIFQRIEDPGFIFAFAKSGKISRVVLPRLGLSFDLHSGGLLSSPDIDHFGVSAAGPHTLSFFGDFASYLLLTGPDPRVARVLICDHPLETQPGLDSLNYKTGFKSPERSWELRVSYFVYRLEKKLLVPLAKSSADTGLAYARLALIFLSEHRYSDAISYLRGLDRSLKSTKDSTPPSVLRTLSTMATFRDISNNYAPEASAVSLLASSIIRRQHRLLLTSANTTDDAFANTLPLDKESLQIYLIHLNRVLVSLLLPSESFSLLSDTSFPSESFESMRSIPASMGPISLRSYPIENLDPSTPPIDPSLFQITPKELKAAREEHQNLLSELVIHRSTTLLSRFPEHLTFLHAALWNLEDIRDADWKPILKQILKHDQNITRDTFFGEISTFVELRYRFLVNALKELSLPNVPPLPEAEKKQLIWEIRILGVFLTASRGKGLTALEVEKLILPHTKLVHYYEVSLDYGLIGSMFTVSDLDEVAKRCQEESLRVWKNWIEAVSILHPVQLSPSNSTDQKSTLPHGPHPFDRLQLSLAPPTTPVSFTPVKTPTLVILNVPVKNADVLDGIISSVVTPRVKPESPFLVNNPTDSTIRTAFAKFHARFQGFLDNCSSTEHIFSLPIRVDLQNLRSELEQRAKVAGGAAALHEAAALGILNKVSGDPSLKAHADFRVTRGARRQLTMVDAKVATAKNWDAASLTKVNFYLTPPDLQQIFNATFQMMLEVREQQRLLRTLGRIDALGGHTSDSLEYQELVRDLVRALDEKLLYNPLEEPIFLVTETEFNIAFWADQVFPFSIFLFFIFLPLPFLSFIFPFHFPSFISSLT